METLMLTKYVLSIFLVMFSTNVTGRVTNSPIFPQHKEHHERNEPQLESGVGHSYVLDVLKHLNGSGDQRTVSSPLLRFIQKGLNDSSSILYNIARQESQINLDESGISEFLDSFLEVVDLLTQGSLSQEKKLIQGMAKSLLTVFNTLLKRKISNETIEHTNLIRKQRSVDSDSNQLLELSERIAKDTSVEARQNQESNQLVSVLETSGIGGFFDSFLSVVNLITEGRISDESQAVRNMVTNLLTIFKTFLRIKHVTPPEVIPPEDKMHVISKRAIATNDATDNISQSLQIWCSKMQQHFLKLLQCEFWEKIIQDLENLKPDLKTAIDFEDIDIAEKLLKKNIKNH